MTPPKPPPPPAQARADKRAAALKRNLARRKAAKAQNPAPDQKPKK